MKSVIFDIGNVLAPFDFKRAYERLAAAATLGALPPDRLVVKKWQAEMEIGRITHEEFIQRMRPVFSFGGSDAEFIAIWEDIFFANPPLHLLVEKLAARGIPLYLLSTIGCIHRKYLERKFPVFSHFRDAIFTYEVGLLKPDPRIYRLAVERFGVDASQTLYVDDLPENCAEAAAVGFQSLLYDWRNHAQTEEKILQHF